MSNKYKGPLPKSKPSRYKGKLPSPKPKIGDRGEGLRSPYIEKMELDPVTSLVAVEFIKGDSNENMSRVSNT